ncbi:Metallo-hydrolase/oxidoreductase protein [Dioscorea alata]|uniref:Metallo-hydrolase/oxidoreductase protein n=1 Tax=Dioscorea alata TaxID=55571 RepID=A0ACB7UDU0_DIOAL|nr:Metallo-hydrolase/oxidoreductase protein [Dioscorea alata]
MAIAHRLVAVIKVPGGDDFLVVRQAPPPSLPEEEYQRYVDTDLWDLPSAPLKLLEGGIRSDVVVQGSESCSDKLDLGNFDLDAALSEVISLVGLDNAISKDWMFWKFVEEAEFGPEPFIHTVFVLGRLKSHVEALQESCKLMSKENALKLLVDVRPGNDRLGPLVVLGLLPDSAELKKWKPPSSLHYQEYPPGVILAPMASRTLKPFHTTNLVVIVSDKSIDGIEGPGNITYGDALLMDPGCCSQSHKELKELVASLPRKLVVFVTHHHHDHIDGLAVVQQCNPDSILLAHENTLTRIGKEAWTCGYTLISGGERIQIGDQQLEAIFAPGHTDGHLALLHVNTNSLVVGDHCVGHGSTILDCRAGGNMKTTYNFLERSPNVLIPMHGRLNMWPKRMLCGYLKHRRDRELSILKAIESGAYTMSDIIAKSYPDLDPKLWIPASWNVRLHVDHLALQGKLPKDFSSQKFRASSILFASKFIWAYLPNLKLTPSKLLAFAVAGGLATMIITNVFSSKTP